MSVPMEMARGKPFFCLVDPLELESMDDWAEWLDAILTSGLVQVREVDGVLRLVEIRRRVANLPRGLRVEVRSNEHPPPHFHVKSPSLDASFAISDCSLLRGKVGPADSQAIRFWHKSAGPRLAAVWDEARSGDCTVGAFRRT
jgi:hypothetical protein